MENLLSMMENVWHAGKKNAKQVVFVRNAAVKVIGHMLVVGVAKEDRFNFNIIVYFNNKLVPYIYNCEIQPANNSRHLRHAGRLFFCFGYIKVNASHFCFSVASAKK